MNEITTSGNPATTNIGQRRADASSARRRLGRTATVAVAVVAALLVWTIAVPIAGIQLIAGKGAAAQTIAPPSIIAATLVGGLGAWGVLALLERFARRGDRIFAIVGWTVLALSLPGPVLTGASGAVLTALLAMHVLVGTTLMIGLPLAARRQRRDRVGG